MKIDNQVDISSGGICFDRFKEPICKKACVYVLLLSTKCQEYRHDVSFQTTPPTDVEVHTGDNYNSIYHGAKRLCPQSTSIQF